MSIIFSGKAALNRPHSSFCNQHERAPNSPRCSAAREAERGTTARDTPKSGTSSHVLLEFSCAVNHGKGGLRPEDNLCCILQPAVSIHATDAIQSCYAFTKRKDFQ